MPEISVIMPVHNGEKYLREAIKSVLTQTFSDFELIIIDDGSTDFTADIIKSIDDNRIVYLKNNQNIGISDTLNKGILESKGKYIARMDADDISLPTRFEKQIDFLKANPEVSVLGCAVEIFGEGLKSYVRTFSESSDKIKVDMLFSTPFAHPSLMFRRDVFNQDLYDGNFNGLEDYELWIRLSKKHNMATLSETLFKYRIHLSQVTQNPTEKYISRLRQLKKQQMDSILSEYTQEEFDSFFEYCTGANEVSLEWLLHIGALFDKLVASDYVCTKSGKKYLTDSLRGILSNCVEKIDISLKDLLYINKRISFFSLSSLYKERMLLFLKKEFIYIRRTVYHAIVNAIKAIKRLRLKSTDFTIISNNCWGGLVYSKYGIPYRTPTAGLYILGDDFVKFCEDFDSYIEKKLEFIPFCEARYYPQIQEDEYPVAKLGDIEIYFMHYTTAQEAEEKWERRKQRINRDKLIFKLSQRECCDESIIKKFLSLPHKNKICFSYDDVPGAIVIPELKGFSGDEQPLTKKHFDVVKYLNGL